MADPSNAPREEGEVVDKQEPDFSKKHPLETKWTLWFDNPNGKQKQATWGQTLRTVYTFDTVEDFWWCVGQRHCTAALPVALRRSLATMPHAFALACNSTGHLQGPCHCE